MSITFTEAAIDAIRSAAEQNSGKHVGLTLVVAGSPDTDRVTLGWMKNSVALKPEHAASIMLAGGMTILNGLNGQLESRGGVIDFDSNGLFLV